MRLDRQTRALLWKSGGLVAKFTFLSWNYWGPFLDSVGGLQWRKTIRQQSRKWKVGDVEEAGRRQRRPGERHHNPGKDDCKFVLKKCLHGYFGKGTLALWWENQRGIPGAKGSDLWVKSGTFQEKVKEITWYTDSCQIWCSYRLKNKKEILLCAVLGDNYWYLMSVVMER